MDRLLPEPLRYLTATPAGFVKLGAGEADLFEDTSDRPGGYVATVPWYFRNQSQPPMAENGVSTTFGFTEIKPS